MEAGKDVGEGVAEDSRVTVKYTEKAGEKTALGGKTAAKATAKAVSQFRLIREVIGPYRWQLALPAVRKIAR